MNDERIFDAGTPAECNRCGKVSPLPKQCRGHLETQGGNVYRLDTMCLLDCGHMDAHWIVEPQIEGTMTFDERFDQMAAKRDHLYQATKPQGEFAAALRDEDLMASCLRKDWFSSASEAMTMRDSNLLKLTIRALRNQR